MSDKAAEAATRRRKWPDGYDPQRTRQALVDSALYLFEREGFDRTTLQQIVSRAKLTKGAFYHHFESKEDLLWRIQDEYIDTQLEIVNGIVKEYESPVDRVRELIKISLQGVTSYRAQVAIFNQERRHLTGERLADITRKRDEVEAVARKAIQAGIDEGAFNPRLSGQIVAFGIFGMCAWAFQWFNPEGSMTIDDVADQFCTIVLDGLLVP